MRLTGDTDRTGQKVHRRGVEPSRLPAPYRAGEMLNTAAISCGGGPAVLNRWRRPSSAPSPSPSPARPLPAGGVVADAALAEETALLLAIGRGDRGDSMRELYHRYERRLYGLGMRLLGEAGLAEELVQETFLRLWRTADRFDPERGAASAFIYTIARRLVIDLYRRPSSRPLLPQSEDDPDPKDDYDRVLTGLAVRDALDTLSEAHRQVLELSYHGDLTQVEIAERLGLSVG